MKNMARPALQHEEGDGEAGLVHEVGGHQGRHEQQQWHRGGDEGGVVNRQRRERVEDQRRGDAEECDGGDRLAQHLVVRPGGRLGLGGATKVAAVPQREQHRQGGEQALSEEQALVPAEEPAQIIQRVGAGRPAGAGIALRGEALPEGWTVETQEVAAGVGARAGDGLEFGEDAAVGVPRVRVPPRGAACCAPRGRCRPGRAA